MIRSVVILAFMAAFATRAAFGAAGAQPVEQNGTANPPNTLSQSASLSPLSADTSDMPIAPIPSVPALSATELENVALHVRSGLSSELYDNFQLFLYVSKAESGRWAQRMFVLAKRPDGTLTVLSDWPVSTGRERNEFNDAGTMLPSFTPAGFYQLDPRRMYATHRSNQWGESMPDAMFFNWTKEGRATGLAIHAATDGEVSLLGTRASAGCVRLSPDAAEALFNRVREQYRGAVPKFAPYSRHGSPGNGGTLQSKADGSLELANGYSVLVFIEDFPGDANVSLLP